MSRNDSGELFVKVLVTVVFILVVGVAGWLFGVEKTQVVTGHAGDLTWELFRGGRGAAGVVAPTIYRTQVPGGWLVTPQSGDGLVYVPDVNHTWLRAPEAPR
jgi:hypothetical protein